MAYTAEFRANVLTAVSMNNNNADAVAEQFGLPRSTVYRWISENKTLKSELAIDAAQEADKVEAEFIDDLKELRNKVLFRVAKIHNEMTPREATVALGILIDKVQLLSGKATDRREVIGNGESVDDAIKRLTRELESRPNRAEIPEVASSDEGVGEN